MAFDPKKHHRRSIRLPGYDYASPGWYYVTICTENRIFLFGDVIEGRMVKNPAGEMINSAWFELSGKYPNLVLDAFQAMPNHIHGILVIRAGRCDDSLRAKLVFAAAGNHQGRPHDRREVEVRPYDSGHRRDRAPEIMDRQGYPSRPRGTDTGSVGRIVQGFKSVTTGAYIKGVEQQGWPRFPGSLWHRNYYEHVIRNEKELNRIREYICNNPTRWPYDFENPDRLTDAPDELEEMLSQDNFQADW